MFKLLGCLVNLIAKSIALILAVLFVLATVVVLVLFNVDQHLLGPEVYKRALVEQRVYERLPALIAETLGQAAYNPCAENPDRPECLAEGPFDPADEPLLGIFAAASPELQACLKQALGDQTFNTLAKKQRRPKAAEVRQLKPCLKQFGLPKGTTVSQGGMPVYLWMLDQADWEAILVAVLPPGWSQGQTESVLTQLFAYLEGRTDAVKVSLTELKARLTGEAGMAAALRLVRAQPPCTIEQLAQLATSLSAGASMDKLLACRPPEMLIILALPEIQKIIPQVVSSLPDQVDLMQGIKGLGQGDAGANPAAGSSDLEEARQGIQRARLVIRLSLILPVGLLLLVGLFGARSLKGLLRWWGVPLLIVGLVGGGLAVAASPAMEWGIVHYVVPKLPGMFTATSLQVGLDLGRSVARTLIVWFGGEAAALGLLGLVSMFYARASCRSR